MILLNSSTIKIIIANIASIVKFYNKSLVEVYSKLRVESIYRAWDDIFIFTNSIVLLKLKVIK